MGIWLRESGGKENRSVKTSDRKNGNGERVVECFEDRVRLFPAAFLWVLKIKSMANKVGAGYYEETIRFL